MMMGVVGGVSLLVVAGVLWWGTRAVVERPIERNIVVGIRTSATQASDAAWEAGHRAALPVIKVVSLVSAGLAVPLILAGVLARTERPTAPVLMLFALGYGTVLVGALLSARAANRAARAVGEGADRRGEESV